MKSIRIVLLSLGVIAMAAFATGCPGSKEAKKMQKYASKMCACQDAKCAQDVHKEMTAWVKEHFKGGKKKGTKKNVKKWKKAQKKFNKCYIEKIKAGSAPKPADTKKPADDKKPAADDKKPADGAKKPADGAKKDDNK